MTTVNHLFVETADTAVLDRLRALFPQAVAQGKFVVIALPPDEWSIGDLPPVLSAELDTRVFHLALQTTANAFAFTHAAGGAIRRRLQYGCDRQGQWERVDGEAESWEDAVFYIDLEQLDDAREDRTAEEFARIEAAWNSRQIRPGDVFPIVYAATAATAVAAYHGLPCEG